MKNFGLGILLVIWMIFTLILACSIIGLFVVMSPFETTSWMRIGRDLKDTIIYG